MCYSHPQQGDWKLVYNFIEKIHNFIPFPSPACSLYSEWKPCFMGKPEPTMHGLCMDDCAGTLEININFHAKRAQRRTFISF